MSRSALLIGLLLASAAAARGPGGALDVLLSPNDGRPAITGPGGEFTALLTGRAPLFLIAEGAEVPLESQWTALPGGRWQALCRVPPGTAQGAYAVEARTDERIDRTRRAAYVQDGFPRYYAGAHISAPRIGRQNSGTGTPTAEALRGLIRAANGSGAAFLLLTGGLTENGGAGEFQALLDVLNGCAIPTFLCPGARDFSGGETGRFLGPMPYAFRFGEDAYIAFGMPDPGTELFPARRKGSCTHSAAT